MARPISYKIFEKIFSRGTDPAFDEIELVGTHYEPYKDEILDNIKFLRALEWKTLKLTSFDGVELVAYYYDAGSDKTAVMCHGYRSHYLSNAACPGRYFADNGYNILMIVGRGHEKSGGKYITFGELEAKDLILWLDKAEKELELNKIVIYGVSLGSNTVMRASEFMNISIVKALVLDCGFTNTRVVLYNQIKRKAKPHSFGTFYSILSRPVMHLVRNYGVRLGNFDIYSGNTRKSLSKSKLPAFFIHGAKDKVVPVMNTRANYVSCPNKKEMFIAKNAEHGAAFAAGGKRLRDRLTLFLQECGV